MAVEVERYIMNNPGTWQTQVIRSRQGKTPKRVQFWNSTAFGRGWLSWNSDFPTKALVWGQGEVYIGTAAANYPNVLGIGSDAIGVYYPTDTTRRTGIWILCAEFE